MLRAILLFFLSFGFLTELSAQVSAIADGYDKVVFEGNKRTKSSFLEKYFIKDQHGQLDSAAVIQGIQWMRNMLLFSDVQTTHVDSVGQKYLKVSVKEKWAILPVFGLDASQDRTRLSLGLADFNSLGNGSIVKAVYHRYDFTSFELFFNNPHLLRNAWGIQLELASYNTLEPVYFEIGSSDYRFEKLIGGLILNREWENRHRLYLGAVYLGEKYIKQDLEGQGPDLLSFNKVLGKVFYDYDKVDYLYHAMKGSRNRLSFEFTQSLEDDPFAEGNFFWKLTEDFRRFQKINNSAYGAARFFFGTSTNNATPFPAFVHDNYVNVRGVGNRVMRGSLELTTNLELRQTILRKKQWVVEYVAFTDISSLRFAGDDFNLESLKETFQFFAGGGARFHLNFLFQAILRVDLAVDLAGDRQPQLLVGIGHFI